MYLRQMTWKCLAPCSHKDTLALLNNHVKSHQGARIEETRPAEHFRTLDNTPRPFAHQVSLDPHQGRSSKQIYCFLPHFQWTNWNSDDLPPTPPLPGQWKFQN